MTTEFLKAVTVKEALAIIDGTAVDRGIEKIGLDEAPGRVAADDIVSTEAIPAFSRSLVDGYAVRSKDTQGAREVNPALLKLIGEVRIGGAAGISVPAGSCVRVSTGSMVPDGADGVVMQEYVRAMNDEIEATRPVHRGENIVYAGEDIEQGAVVVRRGKRINAFDAGALAAVGAHSIKVFTAPQVAVLSSGDEIVPVDIDPPLGMVRDINRQTITALLRNVGAHVVFAGLARDTVGDITEKLTEASGYDLILISGGSSKGERDHITASIERLGGETIFHGVNVRPGKPTIFGRLFGKPIFGLPGHPVSCAMAAARFVLPLVRRMAGEDAEPAMTLSGRLTTNIPSSYGVEEYIRVTIARQNGSYLVTPLFAKSSVISSLTLAQGYVIVPEGVEGLEKDEPVEVYRFE